MENQQKERHGNYHVDRVSGVCRVAIADGEKTRWVPTVDVVTTIQQKAERIAELEAALAERDNRITSLMNERLKRNQEFTESTALLVRCYHCGHRIGWEDGESTQEVMSAVYDFLYEQGLRDELKLHATDA